MTKRKLQIIALALALAVVAGCRREQIRVYVAPKDAPAQEMAHHPGDGHDHGEEAQAPARPRPDVTFKLPDGWRQEPAGRMSIANFSISKDGQEAQVTVTPLPMLAGRDAIIVNMWREQVGLKPLEPDQVAQQLQDVVIGSENGKLFEVEGKAGDGEKPARIVTAMVHRSDASWFYKLSGDAALVEAQKPAFIEFLKSIQIQQPAGSEAPEISATDSTSRQWEVPGTWKQIAPGQMQVARFAVQKDDKKAEVFVSVFPNDTGGTLANVNRWRRQLGLADIDEKELAALVTKLDLSNPNAVLVDLTNASQRMLGAIVPRDGQWWFYKMMGDATVAGAERENFVRFAKSTP